MHRVRLIHWNASETRERARRLRDAGYRVDAKPFAPDSLRALRGNPPDAIVIDLGRLPSQGRDLGVTLRAHSATRHVPLVFVEGDPEKVVRIRKLLPDAVYTTWGRIRSGVKRAIAKPPAAPHLPGSAMAGYAGTPLPKKLGIKPGSAVGLVGAPEQFERTLGKLPAGVRLRRQARGYLDVTLWFVRSEKELVRRIARMGPFAATGGLWIVWPKKSSGMSSDLTQAIVRRVGLASGLVDYKIAAIDATWSGLKFTKRKRR